jgi:hypothetical protein
VALVVRFLRAVHHLLQLRLLWRTREAHALGEEQNRRVVSLATRTKLGVERLRALLAMQVVPATRSWHTILRGVLLDRIGLAALAIVIVAITAILATVDVKFLIGTAVAAGAWGFGHLRLTREPRIVPDALLEERARHLAKLFPAAFVVMGHTHTPAYTPIADGTTYVNLGSWFEEEDVAHRAARTHLVVQRTPEGPVAAFLAWDGEARQPRAFGGSDSSAVRDSGTEMVPSAACPPRRLTSSTSRRIS